MFGKDAIVISLKLFVITALAALCLAFVNKVTAPVIDMNNRKAEIESLQRVLSQATDFATSQKVELSENDAEIEGIYVGTNDKGVAGHVVKVVSHKGYGGDVRVMVGIGKDMKVSKIEILEHSETAGLGAKAAQPKFSDQYMGKSGEFTVTKGAPAKENEISAISSATVTSTAVTNCVNLALKAVETIGGAK